MVMVMFEGMLKPRRMNWARYVARMERRRTAYTTALIGELEKTTQKT
jgi:hypothetical protein